MKISVIIPTCTGREKEIKETVKSILSSDLRNVKEIILAIDKSKEILRYASKLRKNNKKIKIVFSPVKRGRCKAKNEAARKARGEILLFLDDDVEIEDKNYFNIISSDFSGKHIGAVSAREIKLKKTSPLKKKIFGKKIGKITTLGDVISNFDSNPGRKIFVGALPGCNFAVRKNVFFEIGGFDENYDIGTAYREETDLQIRIKRLGYKLVFDPRTYVIHKEKEDKKGFHKWIKWYYVLNTYFYLKNFSPNILQFFMFMIKEFLSAFIRSIVYISPLPILYYPRIFDGILYYKRSLKSTDDHHSI